MVRIGPLFFFSLLVDVDVYGRYYRAHPRLMAVVAQLVHHSYTPLCCAIFFLFLPSFVNPFYLHITNTSCLHYHYHFLFAQLARIEFPSRTRLTLVVKTRFPGERLTRKEALKGMTYDAAYASFREQDLGSLSPGKLADFVVLDTDIMTVEPARILDAKVMATIVDGRIAYGKL